MSALINTELAATCNSLGGMVEQKYVLDPQCYESVRDVIRYLRRDDEYHSVRRYLGESNILQTDFIHIAKTSSGELFDVTIRLLVSLTNPVMLLYKEELPGEKVGRNLYMALVSYSQQYKNAFCDVEFWKVIFTKLSELLEVDWAERSEDNSLQIERLLVLLRNVLQVPADSDLERRPDNDITVHDKILWALRESQTLELLLYLSSNKYEQQYYLHILEIFSLILREQKPELLAKCEIRRSAAEKDQDSRELASLREKEKLCSRDFKNTRTFTPTYVVKNVKTFANKEVIYHKSLNKLSDLKLTQDKRRLKTPKNRCPVDSERPERSSTFSVRMFLKEFCLEFLACGFNNLMGYVKDKLVAGRGLANDESYYFWALKFFLDFSCHANVEVKLISECLKLETFHYAQTQITNCFDNITMDKKKLSVWVKRLHLILKSYRALLQTLQWMDSSKEQRIRESSRILKSNLFYVVEYRELMLDCLLRYESSKYPLSFLRDLMETNHLNLKLLEAFCKSDKIVVQRKKRIIKRLKKPSTGLTETPLRETPEEKWQRIKDVVFAALSRNEEISDVLPFDAASSVPIDDQKEEAMKKIQTFLWKQSVNDAIGLLRSARIVWPENDIFGSSTMSAEDESMILQEICTSDLGLVHEEVAATRMEEDGEITQSEEDEDEPRTEVIEQNFDIQDYVKKLVNKKVVEACSILLANYKKNTALTNHCVVKLLHRIAWDCKTPPLLYQSSLFITFSRILREKDPAYKEIQNFAKHLMKKFRDNAKSNPMIFMELLFWKDVKIAQDIEHGYGASDEKETARTWSEEEEDELRKLWVEYDENMIDGDKVDWIRSNLINQSRSRIGIIKKLKELMLLMPGAQVSKKRRAGKDWAEEEISELTELFNKFKTATDVVTMIKEKMTLIRSKKSIKDKLVELGLVGSLSDLRKKRVRKGKSTVNDVEEQVRSSSSESESESDEPERRTYSEKEAVEALRAVVHMKPALDWLKTCLEECLEDDDGGEGYPLLAISDAETQALEDEHFRKVLLNLGLSPPTEVQVYWEVKRISKLEIHDRIELIKGALSGDLPEILDDRIEQEGSEKSDDEGGFARIKKIASGGFQRQLISNKRRRQHQAEVADSTETKMENGSNHNSSPPSSPRTTIQPTDSSKDDYYDRGRGESKKSSQRTRIGSESDSNSSVQETKMTSKKSTSAGAHSSTGNSSSDEELLTKVLKKTRKPNCLASDSDGEAAPAPEPWKYKRRRCIGSDSEVEETPSDDDRKNTTLEVRKKSKLLDSDSEVEGHNSLDESDLKVSL